MKQQQQPEGYLFNELLCIIATEYAQKFGYSLKVDRLWNKATEQHPLAIAANDPLRHVEFVGMSDNTERHPHICTRQRFGNLRLDMYYPKEGNKGRLAFVGVEFTPNGEFAEAQVFYEPGVKLLSELLLEIQQRWKILKINQ